MKTSIFKFRLPPGLCVLIALLFSAPFCGAQGGQGQFGGGGRAGGTPDGDTGSYQHILTPGDRGEWPLTIRAGETIIVFVTSTNFDPAAQIVDSKGKVLAENDDIRPGDQDSRILYRFATAGEYKILVKGFKSAGGGQYTLTLRRFMPIVLPKGERTPAELDRTHVRCVHRLAVDSGDTLVVTTRSAVFEPESEIYSPVGERVEADMRLSNANRTVRAVFRAPAKGDYYVRTSMNRGSPGGYAITAVAAHVARTTVGAANPTRHMEADGLDLWTLAGAAGDVVRVDARATGAWVSAGLRFLPAAGKEGAPADPASAEEAVTLLPVNPKARGEFVALLKRAGTYQVEVSQPQGIETDYTLSCAASARPWGAAANLDGKLAVGDCDYWTMEAKAGQILRVEGIAEPFDIALEMYDPHGERIESNDDGGGGRNALLTALAKETGRYLLRVHTFGDGGSGAYRLARRPDPVRPLQIDGRGEGTVGAGSSDIWSVRGKAGQTLVLSVRSSDFDTRVSIYGPDAVEVANDNRERDTPGSLLSIRLPISGVYTIWVSARENGGKYVIRALNAD